MISDHKQSNVAMFIETYVYDENPKNLLGKTYKLFKHFNLIYNFFGFIFASKNYIVYSCNDLTI